MAFEEFLILRCLAQRGLEGPVALIQPLGNWITASEGRGRLAMTAAEFHAWRVGAASPLISTAPRSA